LDAVQVLLGKDNLTNIAAFHSQQSIEKAFKALIEFKQIRLQKTHNLLKLYHQISDLINIDDLDMLELIDELYIDSRYPGDMGLLPDGKPSLQEANEFYQLALEIFCKVCEVLGIEKEEL
jgi:HEPN domain-containing protein